MTTRETLIAARALIDTPDKWTQGTMRQGVQRCMVGALCAASSGSITPTVSALRRIIGCWSLTAWNDRADRTHAEVLAAFDKAIEAAA
jgi:hypothetical protein